MVFKYSGHLLACLLNGVAWLNLSLTSLVCLSWCFRTKSRDVSGNILPNKRSQVLVPAKLVCLFVFSFFSWFVFPTASSFPDLRQRFAAYPKCIAQSLRFAQFCFDLQNQNVTRRSWFAVQIVPEKACAWRFHLHEMEETGLLVRHKQ